MPFNSKLIIAATLLFSLCSLLFAAGEVIYDIKVVGNQNVESSLILSAIALRTGDVLDPEAAAKSIKTLNNLSTFKSVEIDTEPYRTGVNVIITVEEYPIVNDVKYEGFSAIKKDKIDELGSIRKGSYWSPQAKIDFTRKLKKEYNSKGYQNVEITFEEHPQEENRVNLIVHCKEGKVVAVRSIVFRGNEQIPEQKLRKRMKTKTAGLLRAGRFDQDKFEQDLQNIINYYQNNGFIDARIVDWSVNQTNEKSLEIVITIEEGQHYKFGTLTVTGNQQFTTETILSKFTLKYGDNYDQEKFNNQLTNVYSLYWEEGFIYCTIEPEDVRDGEYLNVNLKITENTRAKIRQINIGGNTRTKEKVIRRQLEIAPGDYFRRSQVMASLNNIYNLGYFEPNMQPPDYTQINNNGDIDLNLIVQDKSAGTANGGVGYNSADGFVGTLSVSENNLFGNNWSTSLKWEFGGSTQNFEYDFTDPNFLDSNTLLGFNLYNTMKTWSSFYYKIYTKGASVRAGQPLPWINHTRLVLGYSLYAKKYRITDMDAIMENEDQNQNLIELDSKGTQITSSVNATLNRDTRNNVFYPTSGSQMILYSEVAGGPMGGDFNYYKQIAQISWFIETWHKVALRTKWRFGYTAPYGKSGEVPPDERFYLGGTGVDGIRGYADRSIGPAGGGTREIIFSTELGYPIGGDQIVGLLFFDAGDSYNTLREFNFLNFKKGVGAGIRIRSPLGLIGFDYAYNVEKDTWEPHLQIGTTF
ncbi:MAG TPA: outer membrane protein assembly factor BamA [Candidatus Cloacimonadota bacterium]|mgnify:CR=1 FL=1|nr:outer membrane protein assembly factor BamA [Candidatus Cloacimonadota bacterium]HOV17120.1 outer membrane protein assembly factor BamA [Candidatus Cloacimonadota bacterium]HQL15426.1 outer membrane protein assembly factor BamA [Candidatus Cloacimonadota bacterium]